MDRDVAELRARIAVNVVVATYKAGEDLLGKATNLAPVEEGTLRGAGYIALIVNGRRFEGAGALAGAKAAARAAALAGAPVRVYVEVGFATVYAARQHEETTWQHPKGGQAKYLSEPLAAAAPRYRRIIELAANHPGAL